MSEDSREQIRRNREELEALAESDYPAASIAKTILELT